MALPPPSKGDNLSKYNPSEDALRLQRHLEKILDTVVGLYESEGIPLPARRYWMVGPPPEDCAQVVVSLAQMYLGFPGDQASTPVRCDAPRTAVVNIYITRDYPIGELGRAVSPETIMQGSAWSAVDSWILFDSMQEFDKDDFGNPGYGTAIATVTALPPGGGVQTTVLNLSTALL